MINLSNCEKVNDFKYRKTNIFKIIKLKQTSYAKTTYGQEETDVVIIYLPGPT